MIGMSRFAVVIAPKADRHGFSESEECQQFCSERRANDLILVDCAPSRTDGLD
jgi:hypothetical protein